MRGAPNLSVRRRSCHHVALGRRLQETVILWLMVMVVRVVTDGGVDEPKNYLHRGNKEECNYDLAKKILKCNVTDSLKTSVLIKQQWSDFEEVEIDNARSLTIQEQQGASKFKLTILDSQNIYISADSDAEKVRLYMERCKAVKITSLANLINVQQSDIRSVNLDPVMQFDFTESRVTDLSVRATDQKCTIINCTINIMRRVVLEGTFSFQVSDSVIDDIVQLNYTSDFDASMMSNVQVGTVRSDGLVVSKGILTLREVTINTLQPRAIIVRGAELRLEDSVINNTGADGIILENGTIDLKNVTIGGFPRVSLRMERASGIETPFSFVFCNGKVSTNWMWIGIVVGFIIGVVVTSLVGFLVFYIKMKTKRRTDQQGMELLQPKEVSLSPSSPALQLSQERQEQDNAHRQNKTVDDINDQDEYDDVTINMTHQSVSTNHPPPPTNHPALPPTNHPALPPKDHPPLPTALPPPRTNHPPPPTNHPPPPTNHPPPPTNYPPPPTNNSAPPPNNSSFSQINRSFAPPAKLSVKPKIPPPLPIRNQPPLDTAPSDDRDALPAPPAPIDDDQDLYDELDEFEVKEKQEASQTSNVTSKPPSFLHTAVKPPLPGEGNNPYPTRPAHGQAAVPKGLPGRPWPLPKQSNKPPPPPAVTKPSPGNSASLSFDDDENLYEEL